MKFKFKLYDEVKILTERIDNTKRGTIGTIIERLISPEGDLGYFLDYNDSKGDIRTEIFEEDELELVKPYDGRYGGPYGDNEEAPIVPDYIVTSKRINNFFSLDFCSVCRKLQISKSIKCRKLQISIIFKILNLDKSKKDNYHINFINNSFLRE